MLMAGTVPDQQRLFVDRLIHEAHGLEDWCKALGQDGWRLHFEYPRIAYRKPPVTDA